MDSGTQATVGQLSLQRAEFMAEDELIEINPMIHSGVISLMCGDFGPFEPSIETRVPLWLALALKKLRRCRIIPPRWLSHTQIKRYLQEELENDSQLCVLPMYFSEISALLLQHAEDDLQNPTSLRRVVEDLTSTRAGKIRRFIRESVRVRVNAVKLTNLTSHEIEANRPTLSRVLEDLYSLHVSDLDEQSSTPSNTVASATPPQGSADETPTRARTLRRVIRR